MCRDGSCVPDGSCTGGRDCPPPPPPACSSDSDCTDRHVCRDGSCVPDGSCTGGRDCPPPPPPACDVFTQDCPSAQMCVLDHTGDNLCIAAGGEGIGSYCTRAGICKPGLACAALAGSSGGTYDLSIDPVTLTRGGHCLALCSDRIPCTGNAVCSAILGANGSTRSDAGVCYTP